MTLDSSPARAATLRDASGPSVGDVFGRLAEIFSPLATAAQVAGSWFHSTFLAAKKGAKNPQTPAFAGEVPWKRTETSRTIRNANGSYTVESFTIPVNYKGADDVWQPIDNTLVQSTRAGYDWENKANRFKVHLKQDLDEAGVVALVVDGETYRLSIPDARKVKGSKDGSEVRFVDTAVSTDMAYAASATGLKKTITLRKEFIGYGLMAALWLRGEPAAALLSKSRRIHCHS